MSSASYEGVPGAIYDREQKCYVPAKGEIMEETALKLYGEGMSAEFISEYKVDFSLYPAYPLAEAAWVYTAGAMKHSPEGWRDGMSYKYCIAKAFRHLFQWLMGSKRHENGMHHLASVVFYCNALMEYERSGAGTDDREDIV